MPQNYRISISPAAKTTLTLALAWVWAFGTASCLAELTVKTAKAAPPEQVSPAVRAVLGEPCYQVIKAGKPLFEFWLSERVILKEAPASLDKALEAPATATLLGVVRIHQELRDYRDDELAQGVFTMRFGKIPADGNHLGASEYPYFAVLIPAEKDREPSGFDSYRKMTRASSKETASEHPMIMSLRPIKEKPAAIPALTAPVDEHHCIVVSASGRPEGADVDVEIIFEIVVEGLGEI